MKQIHFVVLKFDVYVFTFHFPFHLQLFGASFDTISSASWELHTHVNNVESLDGSFEKHMRESKIECRKRKHFDGLTDTMIDLKKGKKQTYI